MAIGSRLRWALGYFWCNVDTMQHYNFRDAVLDKQSIGWCRAGAFNQQSNFRVQAVQSCMPEANRDFEAAQVLPNQDHKMESIRSFSLISTATKICHTKCHLVAVSTRNNRQPDFLIWNRIWEERRGGILGSPSPVSGWNLKGRWIPVHTVRLYRFRKPIHLYTSYGTIDEYGGCF